MKRVVLWAAVVLIAWFSVKKLFYELASAETQIQWRLEDMVEGFNTTRRARVMDGFDLSFVDKTRGTTREEVGQALVHLFFTRVDRETKAFTMNVSMPEEDLHITVHDSEPPSATVQARFLIMDAGVEFWDLHLTGEMEEDEDGWQFVRTTEVNHSDRASWR